MHLFRSMHFKMVIRDTKNTIENLETKLQHNINIMYIHFHIKWLTVEYYALL